VQTRRPDPQLAIAYVRASTIEQRLSPEAQRASLDAWSKQAGVRIAAVHEDLGVSGGAPLDARPGLVRALVDLGQQRAGFLVVAARSRPARDVGVALAIERAVTRLGARIVSADGTGNGDSAADQFMRTLLDGAAQYERALIAGRTKAALAAKRANGFQAGRVPFGYSAAPDGRLLACEAEEVIVRDVGRLRAAGLSLRAVTATCAHRGYRSRAGTPLGLTQVARLAARIPGGPLLPAHGEAEQRG
jgi:DNA invertase Pin-like site-specific DNA recombinase